VFFPRPANQVAATFDFRAAFFDDSSLNVSQGQMHRNHVLVHRLVATDAEVRLSERVLEIPIDDLTRPTTAVSLQDGVWLAFESRRGKVRRVFLTEAPF
jgi:hypothetical protein